MAEGVWMRACETNSPCRKQFDVEQPPVQSVFDGVRPAGDRGDHASGAGAIKLRPARRRLSRLAFAVRRSSRMRHGLRTRQALSRLEFCVSGRQVRERGLLAQEYGAAAG